MKMNSAQILHELLFNISSVGDKASLFYKTLITELELPEDHKESLRSAVETLVSLIEETREDIQSTSMTDSNRGLLKIYMKPFSSLTIYSSIRQQVGSLCKTFLSTQSLQGLNIIGMALDGKVEIVRPIENADAYLEEVDKLRDLFFELELPKELKLSIDKRLEQIRSSITHYKYWGAVGLEQALTALAGEIVFYHEQFQSPGTDKVTKKLGRFLGNMRAVIAKARGYEKDGGWLIEHAGEAVDMAKKMLGNLPGN